MVTGLQNISGEWRRSINADTAVLSLSLVEKPASSNATASCMAVIQQLERQLEGRKWCSSCPFISGDRWA